MAHRLVPAIAEKVPSQCTVTGWVYKDVYIFWYDDADRVCKHFKASTPTDTAASWSRSAFWGGAARFIYNLGDGFQPEDVLSLASGYWVKQYNDEMLEDLRMIKASMSMLGDTDTESEKDEL